MRRSLLKFAPLYSRHFLSPPPTSNRNPILSLLPLSSSNPSRFRFFSSDNDESSTPPPPPPSLPPPSEETATTTETTTSETSLAEPEEKEKAPVEIPDVPTIEFKRMINEYMKGNEEMLPAITQAILARRLSGKHEETDSEIMEELELQPLDDVKDKEFESDFEELYETDEEIDNLYNARQIVEKRVAHDEYFNMDDKKWEEMIKEGVEQGHIQDTKECEEILEDMLNWDKLLPDEIKAKVEAKFDEIGEMIEREEVDPEEGYRLFKEYEDEMVLECAKMMEAQQPPLDELTTLADKSKNLDDPPGEGPILRWQTRCVFVPGGDSWHPKNRKVKLSVTVKELKLSKHAYRRLRELVGKRYHSGKDELTITSERYEHREENRKDCLRTLYSLIVEAMRADKLVEETRVSYVKEKLKKNKEFMKRLKAKNLEKHASCVAVPL